MYLYVCIYIRVCMYDVYIYITRAMSPSRCTGPAPEEKKPHIHIIHMHTHTHIYRYIRLPGELSIEKDMRDLRIIYIYIYIQNMYTFIHI